MAGSDPVPILRSGTFGNLDDDEDLEDDDGDDVDPEDLAALGDTDAGDDAGDAVAFDAKTGSGQVLILRKIEWISCPLTLTTYCDA